MGQHSNSLEMLVQLRQLLVPDAEPRYYSKIADNYSLTAQRLYSMGRLHDSARFCQEVFKLEKRGLILPHKSAFDHSTMVRIYGRLGKLEKQLEECWTYLEKTNKLGNEVSCFVYTVILQNCDSSVRNEALNLISYARKFTEPPREAARHLIAHELYENPVPSGLMPLDMPTAEFIAVA